MWKYFWENMKTIFGRLIVAAAVLFGLLFMIQLIFWLGLWGLVIDVIAATTIGCFIDAYQRYKLDLRKRQNNDRLDLEDAYDEFRANCYAMGINAKRVDEIQEIPQRVKDSQNHFLATCADYKERWGADDWTTTHENKYLKTCEVYNIKP